MTRPAFMMWSMLPSGVPCGARLTVTSGLVSVIPHTWVITTPWRSRKFSIIDRGTADPPQKTSRKHDRSSRVRSATRSRSLRIVGTAPVTVGRSAAMNSSSGPDVRCWPTSSSSAPARNAAYGTPQALAWNIGTIGITRSRSHRPKALALQTAIA